MKISPEKARRVLSHLHGFDSLERGEEKTAELFSKIPCVQVDPINPGGRNHDLTLFSRIEDYDPEYLSKLLYEKNILFEYYCKMLSILPMEYYPVFKVEMGRQYEKHRDVFKEHSEEIGFILEEMEREPLSSLELRDMGESRKESWRSKKLAHRLLRVLWLSGEIMIHHREGRRKYYTLAKEVVPEEIHDEQIDEDEYKRNIAKIILKSSKLVSPSKASAQWTKIGGVREVRKVLDGLKDEGKIFSLEVDGWKGDLYACEEERDHWEESPDSGDPYLRFLAPLDPLLWNRERFSIVFEHEYIWEVYKPKEDRIYGHYCLPIIFNDAYVSLFEPYLDGDVLNIRNFHLFDDLDQNDFSEHFKKELGRYMEFLGAEDIKIDTSDRILRKMIGS